jgi:hypothetical protein
LATREEILNINDPTIGKYRWSFDGLNQISFCDLIAVEANDFSSRRFRTKTAQEVLRGREACGVVGTVEEMEHGYR